MVIQLEADGLEARFWIARRRADPHLSTIRVIDLFQPTPRFTGTASVEIETQGTTTKDFEHGLKKGLTHSHSYNTM
jgi:hypothetical protein